MTARAKAIELATTYVPPPGDPLVYETGAYAKVGKPLIDRRAKAVTIALPASGHRMAKYMGDQGCVTVPLGARAPRFKSLRVKSRLPRPERVPWPMGDAPVDAPRPPV